MEWLLRLFLQENHPEMFMDYLAKQMLERYSFRLYQPEQANAGPTAGGVVVLIHGIRANNVDPDFEIEVVSSSPDVSSAAASLLAQRKQETDYCFAYVANVPWGDRAYVVQALSRYCKGGSASDSSMASLRASCFKPLNNEICKGVSASVS